MGVKELVLVAQDSTSYGKDLYKKPCLVQLCKELCKIKGIEWIRIHYAYPELIDDELLSFIQKEPKMCKYLDIPLQHIDDDILKSMRRHLGEEDTRNLITKIRTVYPEIKIRSTFIVGYPGETNKQFNKLCNFLKEVKLDYVGFFPYYREEGTVSYYLKKQVPTFIKNMRLKKVQKLQSQIAYENMKNLMSQEILVLVDEFDSETGNYLAHANFMSKNVDFNVKIEDNNNVKIGDFVKVVVKEFDGENLKGEII
jgi:ribosomal protein S12 methylthiotransferase